MGAYHCLALTTSLTVAPLLAHGKRWDGPASLRIRTKFGVLRMTRAPSSRRMPVDGLRERVSRAVGCGVGPQYPDELVATGPPSADRGEDGQQREKPRPLFVGGAFYDPQPAKVRRRNELRDSKGGGDSGMISSPAPSHRRRAVQQERSATELSFQARRKVMVAARNGREPLFLCNTSGSLTQERVQVRPPTARPAARSSGMCARA